MTSFLRFQGSRPGHFKALRTGEASPLPVPLDFARGQGVPHFVTPWNDEGLPPVTQKRHHDLLWLYDIFIRKWWVRIFRKNHITYSNSRKNHVSSVWTSRLLEKILSCKNKKAAPLTPWGGRLLINWVTSSFSYAGITRIRFKSLISVHPEVSGHP